MNFWETCEASFEFQNGKSVFGKFSVGKSFDRSYYTKDLPWKVITPIYKSEVFSIFDTI